MSALTNHLLTSAIPNSSVYGRVNQRCRRITRIEGFRTMEVICSEVDTISSPTSRVPVYSAEEIYGKLSFSLHSNTSNYLAFYSSLVGGITEDPAAMIIPMDDHMVHRGHGVFDTAIVWDGYLYELDAHLDRILRSAASAKIEPPFSREELREIIIETAAVSGIRWGQIRYWLSAGPGGFGLSKEECQGSGFYVIAIRGKPPTKSEDGVKVITSSVPIKPPEFATVKSVNYLPNAMVLYEAEQAGAVAGIWLDQDGFIAEGQSMNCAFVTKDGVLLVPPFDQILAGCTMKRVIELAEEMSSASTNGTPSVLTSVELRRVTVEEAQQASEMMLCGSGVLVKPVTQWDDLIIGDGKPGPVTTALRDLLENDISNGPDYKRIQIPDRRT